VRFNLFSACGMRVVFRGVFTFLGVLGSVQSVCCSRSFLPSVRTHLDNRSTDLREIWYWEMLVGFVRTLQFNTSFCSLLPAYVGVPVISHEQQKQLPVVFIIH
jgi:hypothetical protein